MTLRIVIIGTGYAGISCAEQIRKLDKHCQITMIQYEAFCSRPNLFFRFKFLQPQHAMDYGVLNEEFFTKNQILVIHGKATSVQNNMLHVEQENEQEQQVAFDKLVFATGGVPRMEFFPVQTGSHSSIVVDKSFELQKHASLLLQNLVQQQQVPKNVFVLRNVEEIDALYHAVFEPVAVTTTRHVVVLGTGVLAVDFLSHVAQGLATQQQENLHITWLCRRDDGLVAYSLLQHTQASALITHHAKQVLPCATIVKSVHKVHHVTVDGSDNCIVSLAYSTNSDPDTIIQIPCHALIQAIGVASNVQSVTSCLPNDTTTIQVSPTTNAIQVNDRFELQSKTIFAIGDLVEYKGHCWRNWSNAREQGKECAMCLLHDNYVPPATKRMNMFDQCLRMFDYYVACIGEYQQGTQIVSSGTFFMQWNWQVVDEKQTSVLRGAMLIGLEAHFYDMGQVFIDILATTSAYQVTQQVVQLFAIDDATIILKRLQALKNCHYSKTRTD